MLKLFSAFGEISLRGAEAVEQGLASATQGAEAFGAGLSRAGQSVSSVGDTMSKTVTGPIAGVAGALGALAFRAIATGDDLAKFSRAVNLGVEELQEYEFALGRVAGVSQQETRRALRELTQVLAEATDGNDQAVESLARLGFSMDDITSGAIDTEQAMDAVLRRIKDAGTAAEAQALAMEFFGNRVGTQMANNIREGAESIEDARRIAREQVGLMSQDQAEAAEAAADAWDQFKRSISAATLLIGAEALPIFTELVDLANDGLVPALAGGARRVAEFIKWFTELNPVIRNAILAFIGLLAAVGPVLSIVGRLMTLVGGMTKLWVVLGKALGVLKLALAPLAAALATLSAPVLLIIAGLAALGAALYLNRERVGEWVLAVGRFAKDAGAAFAGWVSSVINMAKNLAREVGRFIADMAASVLKSIGNMVTGALSRMRNLYQRAVGNSIIPDLAADVTNVVAGMADATIAETQRMSAGMADSMLSEAPSGFRRPPRDDRPAGGGTSTYNFQHAVFNTERSFDEKLRNSGHDLTGAF